MLSNPGVQNAGPVEQPAQPERPVSEGLSDSAGRLLLLGLGNDILTDDAIGLVVVREVSRRLTGLEGVEAKECVEMGLALLDFIVGWRELIVVDAVRTGQAPPGHVHEVDCLGLKTLRGAAPHFFGVGEALALGKELGLSMPNEVKILAVEVSDPFTMGTELTTALRAALPSIVARVMNAVLEHAPKALSVGSSTSSRSSSKTEPESRTGIATKPMPGSDRSNSPASLP
ncbi:MAG: hydrogenase maturation protease [Gammaproteobacteria bacterium]|nr:hydrogenase maturation protease [Gammaproteobacteria bacterium]